MLLYLLLVLGTVRVVLYLDYAASMLPLSLESHNLEAKMVLLAYRAEQRLSLYPEWRNYPYVSNWFGPVAPLLIGLVGRASGSDIPGLFAIGRALSFGSALLTTLVVAMAIGKARGRGAALAAGVLGLGSGPMFGFTIMVRPDALAELLGTAGFLACGGRTRAARVLGFLLLVLAILTKQTAAVFLAAVVIARALEGDRRGSLRLFLAACGLLAAIVFAVTLLAEPHFADSLAGERIMPWSLALWRRLLERMAVGCPDLFVLPAIGLWLWLEGGPARLRTVRPAVLTIVLLVGSLALSGKTGADMNYYLSLRVTAALAAGTLWHEVCSRNRSGSRSRGAALAAALAVASLALGQSILLASGYFALAAREAESQRTGNGRLILRSYREAFAVARNPRVRLLSDTGLVDLYQGERAAFGDPWLFRTLVEAGKLHPATIEKRIESQYYDVIITSHDLESPRYLLEDFRFPKSLVEQIRARYRLQSVQPGLFAYGRRPPRKASIPRPPGARMAALFSILQP
jgi:hypothetical protein